MKSTFRGGFFLPFYLIFTPCLSIFLKIENYKRMKCTIKNMSPKTVAIFARINGRDGRFEIGPGKELVADNYETRVMKVYKKKGLISISPYKKQEEVVTQEVETSANEDTHSASVEEVNDILYKVVAPADLTDMNEAIKQPESEPKTLQQIEAEVEQYVEGGYIKGAWTDEDVAFLKKHYPTKGRKYCANNLNRNESSVQKKINALGLKKKKKKK